MPTNIVDFGFLWTPEANNKHWQRVRDKILHLGKISEMINKAKITVDVATSALNEELCIPEFIARMRKVFDAETNYSFRLTIVDNGSSDKTWSLIEEETKHCPRIRGIKMSRTFPFDSALTCGLDHAEGDYLVLMTSDLQDPPETLHELLREIEKGFDQVVVKIRKRSQVPWPRRLLSQIFYGMSYWSTDGLIPRNVSDFRIMSKKVYSQIKIMKESHRFMRGLGAWVGYNSSSIVIERPNRFAGKSKWLDMSFFSVLSTGVKGIFAFSAKPLSILSFVCMLLGVVSFLSLIPLTIFFFTNGVPFGGFGTLIGFAILSFGVIMLALGVLAEYVSLIYEDTKKRPIYLIDQIVFSSNDK